MDRHKLDAALMKLPKESGQRVAQAIARARSDVPKGMDAGQAALAVGLAAMAKEILSTIEQAMEDRRVLRFEGPHDIARQYSPGAVVQRAGGIWVAMTKTSETPGSSNCWRRIGGHND